MRKIMLSIAVVFLLSVVSVSALDYYAVWQDSDYDGKKDHIVGYIQPYDHGTDVVTAYNYYSVSSHMSDPVPEAYKSKIWLYDDGELSLGMFHDVDGGGSPDNIVKWNIKVKGTGNSLVFSDDTGELFYSGNNLYKGRWHYWYNTDGGIVGLDNEVDDDWIVRINPKKMGDIQSWQVYSADASQVFELDMNSKVWITNKKIPDDIPEFTTLGAGLVLLGAGLYAFKKRK